MENPYIKSFPTMMEGKKILYVHGFASSGQSGTVARLKELLPSSTLIAPDLPIHPAEAMTLLHDICAAEQPDLIIGTSMGGMYAEMLYGYDRILVNPAFEMAETFTKNHMLGKTTFFNPRQDGVQEFMMTKQLLEEYKEVNALSFSGIDKMRAEADEAVGDGLFNATTTPWHEEQGRVWGLFGLEDPTVHTYGIFASHYRQALHFHGEHRLNEKILLHSVIPVIRWIDDRQCRRERRIIYLCIEETLEHNGNPRPSMQKAYRYLIEHYDVYIVASSTGGSNTIATNNTLTSNNSLAANNNLASDAHDYARRMQEWAFENLGVAAYNRLILTNHKNLLYGDYLIDALTTNGSTDFLGTRIPFADDTFKTWEEVIEYFARLGGQ